MRSLLTCVRRVDACAATQSSAAVLWPTDRQSRGLAGYRIPFDIAAVRRPLSMVRN